MRREPRHFFAVWPYIVSLTRWSRRRTKTMRSPRSLLETIRAFRSQINSLSRLWSHPRGAAGSQGDSCWDHGGIARAKAPWLPYTHTRRHACWPQLYRGLWVRPGPPPNRLAAAIATATGFCCRRWNWPPYYRSLLPPFRAVPHFWDTSNREMQRLVLRNCVSLYCLYLATFLSLYLGI